MGFTFDATINIPGYWEDQGLKNLNGIVWYRKEIEISENMAGQPAKLYMGRIVDADEMYVNHPEFVEEIWKIEDLRISNENEAKGKKASGNSTKYFVVLVLIILGILFFVRVLKK